MEHALSISAESAVIVRYAEIALKGKNRPFFESVLISNIKACLRKHGIAFERVVSVRGRIVVFSSADCSCLKYVFGISSFSHSFVCSAEFDSIWDVVRTNCPDLSSKTFRVSTQRIDKSIAFTSSDLERNLGARIVDLFGAKVDLVNFNFEVGVELISGRAFVFFARQKGLGGLPVGTQEPVTAIVECPRGKLSALMLLKRGCPIIVDNTEEGLVSLEGLMFLDKFIFKKNYGKAVLEDTEGIYSVGDSLADLKVRAGFVLRPVIAMSDSEVEAALDFYENW